MHVGAVGHRIELRERLRRQRAGVELWCRVLRRFFRILLMSHKRENPLLVVGQQSWKSKNHHASVCAAAEGHCVVLPGAHRQRNRHLPRGLSDRLGRRPQPGTRTIE